MRFEKWQAAGNAYLVIERADLASALTPARVERICHPDLGAGSDGILVLDPLEPGQPTGQLGIEYRRGAQSQFAEARQVLGRGVQHPL